MQAIHHYVIKFVSELPKVGGLLQLLLISSTNKKTDNHNISKILLKKALNTKTHYTLFYERN